MECGTFPQGTFSFYGSFVGFNHGLNITQPKTKTFYVMDITRMGTEELLKDSVQGFLIHANTIVFYLYFDGIACIAGLQFDNK